MSEKKKGLFNRMFSPNGDNGDEEPSEEQVRRWLNEPDGRPRYRPPTQYPSSSSSRPAGLGDGGQQQAFRDLAAGFGREPGRFDPAPYTPPTADQWNPHRPSGGGAPQSPPSGGYSPPQQGGWTPPQRWTAPQEFDDDEEGGGVEVGEVGSGGPLAQAGIRAGDIIIAVDGRDVEDEEDLFAALGSLMPGRTAVLEIVRGDTRLTATVVAPR